jgi:hypothetical protein
MAGLVEEHERRLRPEHPDILANPAHVFGVFSHIRRVDRNTASTVEGENRGERSFPQIRWSAPDFLLEPDRPSLPIIEMNAGCLVTSLERPVEKDASPGQHQKTDEKEERKI